MKDDLWPLGDWWTMGLFVIVLCAAVVALWLVLR